MGVKKVWCCAWGHSLDVVFDLVFVCVCSRACCYLRLGPVLSGPERKGHYEKGLFTGGITRISNLNSLESLENGRILLCFPQSGGSLESPEPLNSRESLRDGLF